MFLQEAASRRAAQAKGRKVLSLILWFVIFANEDTLFLAEIIDFLWKIIRIFVFLDNILE